MQTRTAAAVPSTAGDSSAAVDMPLDRQRHLAVAAWFDRHARDLPWRHSDRTPWGVLVSEIMLQQTPVSRVLPVWNEWMDRWPTPQDLASASAGDAIRAWGRLGYPRRARRLWQCAAAISEHHGGRVPSEAGQLRALPGVGEYTAAAVVAFAFGGHSIVLDTNVRRVIGRVWDGQPLPPAHLTRREKDLAAHRAPSETADLVVWNAAAMELGALVCAARSPQCDRCPVARSCRWRIAGKPGLDDAPRRTQAWSGTDRQVRGRIMAQLRDATEPVDVAAKAALEDVDPGQLERCLAGLVADELIQMVGGDRYAL